MVNVLHLITFGGVALETRDGSPVPRLRRPQLALLAVLASANDRGITRERLASLFWPDSPEEHARHSARQALYALRHELGRDVLKAAGSTLSLDHAAITSDIDDFRRAIAAGERERAVRLACAPFLDGFYLSGASGFDRWIEEERVRIWTAASTALLSLATEASRARQLDVAIDWWRELTTREPLSGRFALGYLRALADRGDRAEALAFARHHEVVMRRELETDPDPEVVRLVAQLRSLELVAAPPVARDVPPPPDDQPAAGGAAPEGAATRSGIGRLPLPTRRWRRPASIFGAAALLLLVVSGAYARQRGWLRTDDAPLFAVGLIREDADSHADSPVLTDMLATNLARVGGLRVLANSRLLELMQPGVDSAARYAEAARRAGATELLEGYVSSSGSHRLAIEVRRVALRTGIVTGVYRATAADRHALVDSLTSVLASGMGLVSPAGSVAAATTTSLVAYRFYEEGLRAFHAGDAGGARRLMRAALEEDSLFAMAAWYEVRFAAGGFTPDGRPELQAREHALRLAQRAPERERLTIIAHLMHDGGDPRAVPAAESLTVRHPEDPQALLALSRAYSMSGNFAGAAAAGERAIVLDSLAQRGGPDRCRWCDSYAHVAEVYSWWDSLPAAMRTLRRFQTIQPQNRFVINMLSYYALRLGDTAQARAWYNRSTALGGLDPVAQLRFHLYVEEYDAVEREAQRLLASESTRDRGEGWWAYFMALRSQGRVAEATTLIRASRQVHPVFEAILALENGDAGRATRQFQDVPLAGGLPPGQQARDRAWRGARIGMAAAEAGDSALVRIMADSVEQWGRLSLYGRDPRLHHYLRGRLQAMRGRHDDAVQSYRAAIHSPSLGFTRVNYDMARSLLQLGRPGDAVAIMQPALRGAMDASNLYLSRTDLHELLAEAFDRAGQPDSAAAHYRKVVAAWRRADPVFHSRRDRAAAWLSSQPNAAR